jgi:hypothetical protein
MTDTDNSGSAVAFALFLGIILTVAGGAILRHTDSTDALLRDRETQISELQQSVSQCHYEFQGYKDGRR